MTLMYSLKPLSQPIPYVILAVSLPIFIYVGAPVFRAAYRAIRNRVLEMNCMYALGMGTAFTASVLGTIGIGLKLEFMMYDTAIFLASFLLLGKYLEQRAKSRTSDSLRSLIELQPATAQRFRPNGELEQVDVASLERGDRILVVAGEQLPIDGKIVEGGGNIDQSMLTGEPMPVYLKTGQKVVGGTINLDGRLVTEVTAPAGETVLAQIIQQVEEAQSSKPPLQSTADRLVQYFIPVVLAIAISSFLVWFFLLSSGFMFALTTFIAVIVIACPCALGLATPTAVTVGIGRAAELGILIKSGEAMEQTARLDWLIFDKTGTLTTGKPQVVEYQIYSLDEREAFQLLLSVEQDSNHPVAKSITEFIREKGIAPAQTEQHQSYGGKGVSALINGKLVLAGNLKLLELHDIQLGGQQQQTLHQYQNKGYTVVFLVSQDQLVGMFALSDQVKAQAKETVDTLKTKGLSVSILSGDSEEAVRLTARSLGIEEYQAEVLPEDKAEIIRNLQQNNHRVGFIGEGINDAIAMTQADVGISLASGTDIAVESGDFVLMHDRLLDVPVAIELGGKIIRRIKQNLFWALIYNAVLIPLAAGVLYPFFQITFAPEWAGLAMALSSVTVVSLSLLLKRYTPPSAV